ncbi:dihydroxyacetone kinase [Streptomyces rubradiris]|uniref:Dihydroxyacetone kinase n=1 Tax=Streptomyces rubradiris TaxID=285531 RepID=A0ABQ3RGU9_STRRR|nr:dihydroxyacetone kinase [Streptomyces rubradiris]GHI55093.1 dihydroxyacetone kinase [Streptomyces rubradiris]
MADQAPAPGPLPEDTPPGSTLRPTYGRVREAQVAQVPQTFFDALAVRTWCSLALRALGRAREEIDAINVYPVADGDTGTNLYLTLESAATAVEAVFAGYETGRAEPSLGDAARAMAHGALIGARGNSGTILAQLLRGMAQVLAGAGETSAAARADGPALRLALRRAADSARQAVAHPVEGTVLTVASAAADAAEEAGDDCRTVARAAYEGARAALAATPEQLGVLRRAGVVDAGGRGLVTVLGALVEAVTGEAVREPAGSAGSVSGAGPAGRGTEPACQGESGDDRGEAGGPAFEVIYLLEADDAAVARLRARLDALGDSLVVVGGDGLWNVHVHVDDAGAAVEAGVEAGRPYRIRITHFGHGEPHPGRERPSGAPAQRAVVAVVPGEGLAGLYGEAGATTVLARPGEPPASGELVQALRRAHAHEVVLLPNDAELRHTAGAAAEQARTEGIRVALIPTRSAVQGIAALAVHEPRRRFDEDVVQMTAAAGATRYAEVVVAERQSWTTAGICQAGDVLGLIDGDVAVIGTDVTATARTVLDRMLQSGGELVTLVVGDEAPETVAAHLEARVRESYLAVDTVVYRGGRQGALLLIGVE